MKLKRWHGRIWLLAVVIAVNLLLFLWPVRWDTTAEHRFSLSPETLRELKALRLPVTVDFYRSRSVNGIPPQLQSFADYVEQLLTEYERLSSGRLTVCRHDPVAGSSAEESAMRSGMQFTELRHGDVASRFCLGVCFRQLGHADVSIGVLTPQCLNRLEYDMTLALARLSSSSGARIGVLSRLPLFGAMIAETQQQVSEWAILSALRQCNYSVNELTNPADLARNDLVLLIQPPAMDEAWLTALDHYVHCGGHLLAFLDPACWTEMRLLNGGKGGVLPIPPDMSKLLQAWGVHFVADRGVLDRQLATIILNRKSVPENRLEWLTLNRDRLSQLSVITSQLSAVELFMAGSFDLVDCPSNLVSELLLKTTDVAQLCDARKLFRHQRVLEAEYEAGGKELCLGLSLEGIFPSAYGDTEEGKPSQVILIGDADCLADNFTTGRNTGNQQLLLNCVDSLCAESGFMTLRNRSYISRTLTALESLREENARHYQERLEGYQKERDDMLAQTKELQIKSGIGSLSEDDSKQLQTLQQKITAADRELRSLQVSANYSLERFRQRVVALNFLCGPVVLAVLLAGFLLWRRYGSIGKWLLGMVCLLVVVGGLVWGGGKWSARTPEVSVASDKGVPLLAQKLNRDKLQVIRIKHGGDKGSVTLERRADDTWSVAECKGYPADNRMVNMLLESLVQGQGTPVELNKDVFDECLKSIGLLWPEPNSRVDFESTDGTLFSIAFGNSRLDYQGMAQGRYLQLSNNAQVMLSTLRFAEVDVPAKNWLAKRLPGITSEAKRIARESEMKGFGWSLLACPGGYEVEGKVPSGRKVNAAAVTNIIDSFRRLTVLDVVDKLPSAKLECHVQVVGNDDILYDYDFYTTQQHGYAKLTQVRSVTKSKEAAECMATYGGVYMEVSSQLYKAFLRNRSELFIGKAVEN